MSTTALTSEERENLIAHGHEAPGWTIHDIVRAHGRITYALYDRTGERATIVINGDGQTVKIAFAHSTSMRHAAARAARFAACAYDYIGDAESDPDGGHAFEIDALYVHDGIVTLRRGDAITFTAVHFELADEML